MSKCLGKNVSTATSSTRSLPRTFPRRKRGPRVQPSKPSHLYLKSQALPPRKHSVTNLHKKELVNVVQVNNSCLFCESFETHKDWLWAGRSGVRIPGGGEIFRTCPDRPWGPPSLLYNWYRVFPWGKEQSGRDADLSPPSSAGGHERVELYLYSPHGPYGLYRASVPVQG